MSCGVACRYSSDPALLWLWLRLAAVALILPLAWELPYTMGVAQKQKTKQNKMKKKKTKPNNQICMPSHIIVNSESTEDRRDSLSRTDGR